MKDIMLKFPVSVTQSNDGDYVARLVDLPDGPQGSGIDPYAALEDLTSPARVELSRLQESQELPEPSPVDDRPVVTFDSSDVKAPLTHGALATGKGDQSEMIGYSWTNHIVLPENLDASDS